MRKLTNEKFISKVDSVHKGLYKYDKTNYDMCIEYDGIQHYKPVDFFGGIKTLKDIKKRDNIKTKYCQENNIKLIRIPYNKEVIELMESINFNI